MKMMSMALIMRKTSVVVLHEEDLPSSATRRAPAPPPREVVRVRVRLTPAPKHVLSKKEEALVRCSSAAARRPMIKNCSGGSERSQESAPAASPTSPARLGSSTAQDALSAAIAVARSVMDKRREVSLRRDEARRELAKMVRTVEFNDPYISPMDPTKAGTSCPEPEPEGPVASHAQPLNPEGLSSTTAVARRGRRARSGGQGYGAGCSGAGGSGRVQRGRTTAAEPFEGVGAAADWRRAADSRRPACAAAGGGKPATGRGRGRGLAAAAASREVARPGVRVSGVAASRGAGRQAAAERRPAARRRLGRHRTGRRPASACAAAADCCLPPAGLRRGGDSASTRLGGCSRARARLGRLEAFPPSPSTVGHLGTSLNSGKPPVIQPSSPLGCGSIWGVGGTRSPGRTYGRGPSDLRVLSNHKKEHQEAVAGTASENRYHTKLTTGPCLQVFSLDACHPHPLPELTLRLQNLDLLF
uniref:Uncharacterized protein n=1 Tax=Oryza meridionalis TaxID=40149 RepID=A0A0E0EDK5_9ORYZ